ncbi:MAG: MerR family transcriptional regulator [Cyanobacteriota bacterium]|nr:MerR family transcriptional regulator [Cyanobacteriota bacterium]
MHQKIGTVATRSGVTVKTIRFYCDEGLLNPVARSEGGYRLFDERVYAELDLIRSLRSIDIPLSTIRQILDARRSGICTCASLKEMIRSKIEGIQASINSLETLRTELSSLLDSWEDCGGRTSSPATAE